MEFDVDGLVVHVLIFGTRTWSDASERVTKQKIYTVAIIDKHDRSDTSTHRY